MFQEHANVSVLATEQSDCIRTPPQTSAEINFIKKTHVFSQYIAGFHIND